MDLECGHAVTAVAVALLAAYLWKVLQYLARRPHAVARDLREQGVGGPRYRFWSGCLEEIKSMREEAMELVLENRSHDITARVMPHFAKWIKRYGETFLFWVGPQAVVCVSEQEMIKQVLASKDGLCARLAPSPEALALVGKGLVYIEGAEWERHRRVVGPAFAMDKLKSLTKTMAACVQLMLDAWQVGCRDGAKSTEVEVSSQFQILTGDVISHTAFGGSYKKGKQLFLAHKQLLALVTANFLRVNFPGSRYIPSKRNLQTWKLKKRIRSMFMDIIRDRLHDQKNSGCGGAVDLLGMLLEARERQEDERLTMDEIIDECKTFFVAGHETTSHLLTWTLFLLSTNLDWQQRLREEVLRVCGASEVPNADMAGNLKLLTMVLLEALRLYSPILLLRRKAAKDLTLAGNISIPKDTLLMMPIAVVHRKKEVWGEDADEFNPLRFENGITKAAFHPNAFLAFSVGPKACIGQNFAMLEAKIAIAMILQRFSFSVSPSYRHAPVDSATALQPQYGLPIILHPICR